MPDTTCALYHTTEDRYVLEIGGSFYAAASPRVLTLVLTDEELDTLREAVNGEAQE
jgi:hypothetical protein